jgi:hypothetical protein
MLELELVIQESFDDEREEFIYTTVKLQLEHSLVSLSKWESRAEKPFLSSDKTPEETMAYVVDMVVSPEPFPGMFQNITEEHIKQIQQYIGAKMTATWFQEKETSQRNREVITAELIYYWMIAMQIPFECQHWHLNRLLTLIRVCNLKNTPPKKMTAQEVARRNRELNQQRRAQLGTRG